MTRYTQGADFERKVKVFLLTEKKAYFVIRSAGSRSIVDLLAFWDDKSIKPWMIQVKKSGRISLENKKELKSLASTTNCNAYLAYQKNGKIQLKEL